MTEPAETVVADPSVDGLASALDHLLSGDPASLPVEVPPVVPEAPPAEPEAPPVAEPAPAGTDPYELPPETLGRMTDAAKAQWGQLRKELKEERERMAEVLAKSQEAERELADLRTEREKFAKEMETVAVERTPKFRAEIVEPIQRVLGEMEQYATDYSLPVKEIGDILDMESRKEQSERLEDLLSRVPTRDRAAFYNLIDQYADLDKKRSAALANAEVFARQAEEERRQAMERETETSRTRWSSTVGNVAASLRQRVPALSDGDVQAAMAQPLGSRPLDVQAYAAVSGMVLPGILKEMAALQARNAELEATIGKVRGASPGGSGGAEPAAGSGADDDVMQVLDAGLRRIFG